MVDFQFTIFEALGMRENATQSVAFNYGACKTSRSRYYRFTATGFSSKKQTGKITNIDSVYPGYEDPPPHIIMVRFLKTALIFMQGKLCDIVQGRDYWGQATWIHQHLISGNSSEKKTCCWVLRNKGGGVAKRDKIPRFRLFVKGKKLKNTKHFRPPSAPGVLRNKGVSLSFFPARIPLISNQCDIKNALLVRGLCVDDVKNHVFVPPSVKTMSFVGCHVDSIKSSCIDDSTKVK